MYHRGMKIHGDRYRNDYWFKLKCLIFNIKGLMFFHGGKLSVLPNTFWCHSRRGICLIQYGVSSAFSNDICLKGRRIKEVMLSE